MCRVESSSRVDVSRVLSPRPAHTGGARGSTGPHWLHRWRLEPRYNLLPSNSTALFALRSWGVC